MGARPATRDSVHGPSDCHLDAIHGNVATHVARRTNVPDGQPRALYVAPTAPRHDTETRVSAVRSTQLRPVRPIARFIATSSSRGPPRG
jgi:hypothetical protein